MMDELNLDAKEIFEHLRQDESYVRDLCVEESGIIFHDNPMRLGVSLGVR